jgi:hypothetical protein
MLLVAAARAAGSAAAGVDDDERDRDHNRNHHRDADCPAGAARQCGVLSCLVLLERGQKTTSFAFRCSQHRPYPCCRCQNAIEIRQPTMAGSSEGGLQMDVATQTCSHTRERRPTRPSSSRSSNLATPFSACHRATAATSVTATPTPLGRWFRVDSTGRRQRHISAPSLNGCRFRPIPAVEGGDVGTWPSRG